MQTDPYYLKLEVHMDRMSTYLSKYEIEAMREFNRKLLRENGHNETQYLKLINSFMDYLIIRNHYVENEIWQSSREDKSQ